MRSADRELDVIARVAGVRSVVQGDLAGTFLDAVREPDGEAVAAVTGFLAATLLRAGEHLGLGALRRVWFQGPSRARLVLVQEEGGVLAAVLESSGALAAVERALETQIEREP
jgi:hypothetical protein